MANNKRIKIAGYAKRIFFNDNIEYTPTNQRQTELFS